jgi:hypothetical protein
MQPSEQLRLEQHRAVAIALKVDAHIKSLGSMVQVLDACSAMTGVRTR